MVYGLVFLFNIMILMLLIWGSFFTGVLIHEIGHALMYRMLLQDSNWHISLGTGKLIIKINKISIRLIPLTGYCYMDLSDKGSKLTRILISLGGALANGFFIVVSSFILSVLKSSEQTLFQNTLIWFFEFSRYHQASLMIFSLIPFEFQTNTNSHFISDGMHILSIARETK